MVNHQGAARRNDRNVATTAISSPSVVALILVVFLGVCLSLAESSPTGLDHGGSDAEAKSKNLSPQDIRKLHNVIYGNVNPFTKRMAKFIVHRRGVPLIIHKRIPYIVHRKRMGGMDDGFHGDTFSHGFGDFSTTRKKRLGDYDEYDTFSQGFGDFETTKKKRFDTSLHGDTWTGGFGDFTTV